MMLPGGLGSSLYAVQNAQHPPHAALQPLDSAKLVWIALLWAAQLPDWVKSVRFRLHLAALRLYFADFATKLSATKALEPKGLRQDAVHVAVQQPGSMG